MRLVFLAVGIALLGVSFGLGVLTGRYWAQRAALALESGESNGGRRESAAGGRGDSASGRLGRSGSSDLGYPQIQERLTFYETLPAPLGTGTAADKPAERPGRRDARPEVRSGARPESKLDPKPASALESGPAASAPSAAPAAYTVQVAAYRSRAQAEALRQKLGETAYVVEAAAESGVAYRVRVGAYATRTEAEAAAARMRTERALAAFITTR